MRIIARAHLSGQIKLLGIVLNACMEESVASLDGFLQCEGVRGVPVGLDSCATDFGGTPRYQHRLATHAADYQTVRGIAKVDAETGENRFYQQPDGKHEYVIRRFEPDYYARQIDFILRNGKGISIV